MYVCVCMYIYIYIYICIQILHACTPGPVRVLLHAPLDPAAAATPAGLYYIILYSIMLYIYIIVYSTV